MSTNTAATRAAATPAGETPAPTPPLEQLSAKWKEMKDLEDMVSAELEQLKAAITAAGGKPGYEDANLVIREASKVDPEHARVQEVLRAKGALEKVQETTTSTTKLRALAELEPEVAKVLEEVAVKSPRFERPRAKKT